MPGTHHSVHLPQMCMKLEEARERIFRDGWPPQRGEERRRKDDGAWGKERRVHVYFYARNAYNPRARKCFALCMRRHFLGIVARHIQ
eukprot:gene21494-3313_t